MHCFKKQKKCKESLSIDVLESSVYLINIKNAEN